MSHFPLRNQRPFLFPLLLTPAQVALFTVGPLQPGEELDEIFVNVFTSEVVGAVSLRIGASEIPVTATSFLTDAVIFNPAGTLPLTFQDPTFIRQVEIPIHRAATDRERFFHVQATGSIGTGVITGMVMFSVRYFPEHVLSPGQLERAGGK